MDGFTGHRTRAPVSLSRVGLLGRNRPPLGPKCMAAARADDQFFAIYHRLFLGMAAARGFVPLERHGGARTRSMAHLDLSIWYLLSGAPPL